jgi:hypothetical protein
MFGSPQRVRQQRDTAENLTSKESLPNGNPKCQTMDEIGYVLSEVPVLLFVIWFAFRLVQYRRYRRNQPIYSDKDRQLLFSKTKTTLEQPVFLGLARAILAATAATYLEILTLAHFGAAILSATLLLTSAAIVRWFLVLDT